ncbi:MAG: iron chelate uptake ABC transporter family permease subunit [Acidobacteriota bacterium]
MTQQLQVLFLPFLACLILTGIHVYLGIHVISRKVIFVDIALAQIAALGSTVAFLLGFDPRSEGSYFFSLGFAVLAAAVFALTRTERERVPQEAIIGLAYATATAAAILLADIAPHGSEHLRDLLAGSIVWVTPEQIIKTALLYGAIGGFHFAFRRRFLEISMRPQEAYARGVRVRFWDFLFYLSFGVVITSSVQIAGVLLVFCYLVAPAVFAVTFFDDLRRRLVTGWIMATVVSAVGLFFSYDRPSGPTIIIGFAVALAVGSIARAISRAPRRSRALAVAGLSAALVGGVGWLLHYLGMPAPAPAAGEAAGLAPGADAPEHAVGGDLQALRSALRDTHTNVRVRAVAQLAATGDPRILPDVIDALHDQSAAVREAAAEALARLGSRSAAPPLKQALRNRDEDEWVRLRMAQALAGLGDRDGLEILLQVAHGAAARLTRLEALAALARFAAFPDPTPSDPDSEEGAALLGRVEAWWTRHRDRLEWDPDSRTFRP